jgi:uncharacterized protein YuzB (UPF0349 family)
MLSIRLLYGFVAYCGIVMSYDNLLVEGNVSIKNKKKKIVMLFY